MADLLTLSEYKSLQGIQTADTRNDAQISALLPAASRAIRTFTGRSFEVTTGVASPRVFQYDGEDLLDIDDCETVTSVTTDAGIPGQTYTLDSIEWTAMPQSDSVVYYYLLLHGGPYYGMSPEMGFERNLDNYEWHGKQPLLTITATWGWPAIPDDVKLATALTVGELVTSPGHSEGVTAEAIEGWSRSWGARSGMAAALAVPNRARDLLVGYQRIFV